MTRDDVERELRAKLSALTADDQPNIVCETVGECVSVLLPWVMEIREEAAMQERIDDGQMP